jgi:hypothetical protein
MRAVALWCSRPVHGPCGEGEKGVDEPRCRAQLWNEGERRRASAAFDLEKKGKGEGSGAGGATRRNEERGGAVTPPGGGQRGGGGAWQPMGCGRRHLRPAGSGGCGSVSRHAEAGEQGSTCGLAGGRKQLGRSRENSADLDLK